MRRLPGCATSCDRSRATAKRICHSRRRAARNPSRHRSRRPDGRWRATAVARNAVLAMLEQDNVTRIRVGWTLEDDLIVMVHDDGPGRIAARALPMLELTAQAEAVDGQLELETIPDWGTRVRARLPLGIPAPAADNPFDRLQPREREVLELVAAGRRNREIAAALHISENTVKFHVGNILRKLEAGSRGQAAALARQHAGSGSVGTGVVDLQGRRNRADRRFG